MRLKDGRFFVDKPCTPDEIGSLKLKVFPKEVFQSVNELLAENFTAGRADIYQDDIIARIMSKMEITRQQIFDKGLLNFEEVYSNYGWKVSYDKPGYNESYKPVFRFRRAQ
jgi:hypothetical protein